MDVCASMHVPPNPLSAEVQFPSPATPAGRLSNVGTAHCSAQMGGLPVQLPKLHWSDPHDTHVLPGEQLNEQEEPEARLESEEGQITPRVTRPLTYRGKVAPLHVIGKKLGI